jgi:uncharacterized membrane protein
MTHVIAYVAALIVFGILDAIWLWTMSARIYRPVLGDILVSDLRMAPALVFYFLYPVGLTFFAIAPALKSGDWLTAALHAAFLAIVAYGTYDLTNYATLRNWNLEITIIDLAYGATVSAISALAGFMVARALS